MYFLHQAYTRTVLETIYILPPSSLYQDCRRKDKLPFSKFMLGLQKRRFIYFLLQAYNRTAGKKIYILPPSSLYQDCRREDLYTSFFKLIIGLQERRFIYYLLQAYYRTAGKKIYFFLQDYTRTMQERRFIYFLLISLIGLQDREDLYTSSS